MGTDPIIVMIFDIFRLQTYGLLPESQWSLFLSKHALGYAANPILVIVKGCPKHARDEVQSWGLFLILTSLREHH